MSFSRCMNKHSQFWTSLQQFSVQTFSNCLFHSDPADKESEQISLKRYPRHLEFRHMIVGRRDRGRRIQIVGHSDSNHLYHFGASSMF